MIQQINYFLVLRLDILLILIGARHCHPSKTFINLRLSVAGIIFLGAPFQGSDGAVYGKWLAQITRLNSTLLESLVKDHSSLHALSRNFWDNYNDGDIAYFYESEKAVYGPWTHQVCSYSTAGV